MGQWFFEIDMLSCLASQNGRRRVPVVGSGYDDGLNFGFVENFPKVADNFGDLWPVLMSFEAAAEDCFGSGSQRYWISTPGIFAKLSIRLVPWPPHPNQGHWDGGFALNCICLMSLESRCDGCGMLEKFASWGHDLGDSGWLEI